MDIFIAVLKLFGSLILVLFLIYLAYYATKQFSKKYKLKSNGKNIRVLERSMISQDKMLLLTKVNDKVYFLGITGEHIQTIDTIDAAAFPEPEVVEEKLDFATVFKDKLISQLPFKKPKSTDDDKNV